MELPKIEIPALTAGAPPLSVEVGEADRASVLVVDDTPAKLNALAAIVGAMKLKVVAVPSGREALRHLLTQDFALILLDVYMPTLDGYETARLIRSRPRTAHTPLIFVTAEAHADEDLFRAYSSGAVDWIVSPIVPEILQAKIRVFVELYYLSRIAWRQNEELQQHSEEIARQNLRLEAASRMKSEFLANMSHELRTPLNTILGFAELLKDGLAGTLNPEQQAHVNDIFDSGKYLLSLINDILDLAKIEAGKMTLELASVDIASVAKSCLIMFKESAIKHNIELGLELPSNPGTLLADGRKLRQIVYNLLSNAVKFSPAGGVVRLCLRAVAREQVALEPPPGFAIRLLPLPLAPGDEFLEIAVRDNGIGIAEPNLTRLFEAFLQIDASRGRQFEGTGLGLALVRSMVALHGGTAGVESAPGIGSRFVVWLPWRRAQDNPAVPAAAAPAAAPAPLAAPSGNIAPPAARPRAPRKPR